MRLTPASKSSFNINGKDLASYFATSELQKIVSEALPNTKGGSFLVSAKLNGGGIHSQAEALRHGIARALSTHNLELKDSMKKAGFLKRDPRAKERRKFGLKKARKSPQWSKR